MLYCLRERERTSCLLVRESTLGSDRPLWVPSSSEVTTRSQVQGEFAAYQTCHDRTCNRCTESGGHTPEPVPSPGLTDQSTQETTPTGVAGASTPPRSGRVSQPPKALADYVLYWTFQNLLPQRNLFEVMNAVYVLYWTFQNLLPQRNLFEFMYFTEHFRICFLEGTCLKSWTLFTLILFRLNIYEQVHIWDLNLSLCSHSLV